MQKLVLALSMAAMLGIGAFLGSTLMPPATAEEPQAHEVQVDRYPDGIGSPVYPPGLSYGYPYPPRLQVVSVPSPEGRGSVIFLLDNVTGETYVLDRAAGTGSFYWRRISRR